MQEASQNEQILMCKIDDINTNLQEKIQRENDLEQEVNDLKNELHTTSIDFLKYKNEI